MSTKPADNSKFKANKGKINFTSETSDPEEIHEIEPLLPPGELKRDGMTLINIAAYSVGHVYNDFWATWWFMYLLYFLTYPVGLGAGKASYALLAGQIADGLATNIVGFFIDKTNTRIGKKKPWYIVGFILVVPTFILTFNTCALWDIVCGQDKSGCSESGYEAVEMVYFCTLPALFNIGWAAVQIGTMSVVVSLTYSQGRRDKLVGLRNGFTYISNLSTLVVAIIFILTIDDQILTFRLLAYTLTLIGLVTSLFFIFGVPEAKLSKEAITYDKAYRLANGCKANGDNKNRHSESENISSWTQWLVNGAFYIHALVYMFARMAVNVTMTLTPFYLIHVLKYEQKESEPVPPVIATVPLASYTTVSVKKIETKNRKKLRPKVKKIETKSQKNETYKKKFKK